jgi:exopolyphosphatase / guanosine-5'-triphosphate,3'-diphosphate pyrophosphatase
MTVAEFKLPGEQPPAASPEAKPKRRRQRRIAAIDVGTNSIHMIVVEAQRHGFRVIDKEKAMVQLGLGSLEGKPLTPEAMERGVAALKSMAEIAGRWRVDETIAVATSALREAPNRRAFVNAVEKAAGIRVRVIAGEEEADYIYRAVRSAVDFHDGTALCIDIGGGSMELVVATQNEVFFTHSEPVGALRLTQRFLSADPPGAGAITACRAHIERTLKKTLKAVAGIGYDFTIGSSGTIVTLAGLAAGAESGTGNGHGVTSGLRWLSRDRLRQLIEEMAPMTVEERCRRFSLDPKRALTIVAGGLVLEAVMERLGLEQVRACDVAMREGLVEHALGVRIDSPSQASVSVRRRSVLQLAERSDVDRGHATRVARLALRIFDQLQDVHLLRTGERELLEYAALLHEIGTHVSYQGHHKHTYYLISHAGLRGFTGDQVAVLANVARYYRKAPPSPEHPGFAELSAAQQQTVCQLSAILRMAVALDRGRRGAVRDVGVESTAQEIVLTIRPRFDCEVEAAAARKRARHLGRTFDRKVTIESSGRKRGTT